jgi:hypothetical protein
VALVDLLGCAPSAKEDKMEDEVLDPFRGLTPGSPEAYLRDSAFYLEGIENKFLALSDGLADICRQIIRLRTSLDQAALEFHRRSWKAPEDV